MFNLPGSPQDSGSYVDLLKRMTQRVQQSGVADRLLEGIEQVFERELDRDRIVLSRPERTRLYRQVTKAVLSEMVEKLSAQLGNA